MRPDAKLRDQRPRQRVQAEHSRLTLALLLSLLIHTLLLSLTFGGEGLGLPGFDFPWRARRIEVPNLRVFLVPAQVTASAPTSAPVKEQLQRASIEPSVTSAPIPPPSLSTASPASPAPPTPGLTAVVIAPDAKPTEQTKPATETKSVTRTKPAADAKPEPAIANDVVPAQAPLRTEGASDSKPPPIPAPAVIAVERANEPILVVPPASSASEPVVAALSDANTENAPHEVARADAAKRGVARQEAARVEAARVEAESQEATRQAAQQEMRRQAARDEAARVEVARQEAAQLESQRREAARVAAAKLETQRQAMAREEASRIETAKMEAARLEAQRQEASRIEVARVAAAQLEAQRLESARQAAARAEVARVEAARLENERIEAARQAAVQQAVVSKEAARLLAEKEEDARRLARRLAMGRQLNEEAARREAAEIAARAQSTLPYSYSTARRARLWGRTDSNVELTEYADAWARRIQFNTSVETVRDVAKRPHINPMVTVAIRSDGTVESVTFVVSSGVAEVDESIRRIVQSVAPNPAFPPGLASAFDVIEVRRTWSFDVAVRLH